VEELEKARTKLAESLTPPPMPPAPPSSAPQLTEAMADLTRRVEQAKKRAAEIEVARTRKPLDGPPIPFQGDHGLDAAKIQGLIKSLLQGSEVKTAQAAMLRADPGSVKDEIFAGSEQEKTSTAPAADEWPEELRTPSSKKRPTKDGPPKAPPRPAVDDESIGKSWGEEDDL
jgi:hypothetical protein